MCPLRRVGWLYLLERLWGRAIMTPAVVTVHGTTPVREAGQMFLW